MRVLVVCTSYQVFGAEIATLDLLRQFKKRGFELLAVTSTWTDGEFSKRLAQEGVAEMALPLGTLSIKRPQWTLDSLAHAPKLWWGWASATRDFQPEVLLFTNPRQAIWLYPWLKRQPSFLVEHTIKEVTKPNRWMYSVLDRRLRGFIAVSKFMARHLHELGVTSKKIHVIYNCFDLPMPTTIVPESDQSIVRIGIVGQISLHKGHDCLLEAARILKNRGLDFQVLVFGAGTEEYISDLKRRVDQVGLSDLWNWMGYLENRNEIYRRIDICVVPSQFDEPFGLTALEASSRGIPVVASNRGGLPEIVIDGENGLLFNSGNAIELSEKLEDLISDKRFAAQIGKNGSTRAPREFQNENTVAQYERLFGCQS